VFISFEGLDGTGKTTQAALLAGAARAAGREVVAVREPGGTAAGERIRALLLDPEARIAPWAEALLYAAARAELVAEVIRPALDRGATVIADRYVDSSLAYQGVARGLGVEEVLEVNLAATGRLLPDRTIVLDLPRDVAAGRLDGAADRMESEADQFHASVADGFAAVARRFPERVVVVDGSGEPGDVAARVQTAVGL
jgi:dTMP kinase